MDKKAIRARIKVHKRIKNNSDIKKRHLKTQRAT